MARLRTRELRLLALVALNAVGIAGYLIVGLGTVDRAGGWRRVDRAALMERIREGRLVQREARWYRVVDLPDLHRMKPGS